MSNRGRFKCPGLGHVASDCPNRKVIALAEYAVVKQAFEEEGKEEDFENDLEETQEVVEEDDEGEMLVLRRVLSG